MKLLFEKLSDFPVSFFSVVMGLAGYALAVEKIEQTTGYSLYGWIISLFALTVFSVLSILYAAKWYRFPNLVRDEFDDPVRLHFFPTFSIGLLLLSIAFLDISPDTATVLWTIGTLLHLILSFVIVSIWIRHDKFHPDHLNPSWFIPIVGNLIVPIAGMRILPGSYLWFFFSIGIIFWIMLLALFLDRAIFHKTLSARLIPTFFIIIAPPAVGAISYILMAGDVNEFAYILYFFALFLALLFLANFPMFTKIRFSLSWWAFSFPICALSIASSVIFTITGEDYLRSLSLVIFAILTIVIVTLLIRTTRRILQD
ncbi:MAG: C4-dicarboxylate ABC transporter [Candidatus Moranbacteria bacterium]|nr:C4-dicarboxylate ABC transporter [Candidatus Moranbacteria bacterium]